MRFDDTNPEKENVEFEKVIWYGVVREVGLIGFVVYVMFRETVEVGKVWHWVQVYP